VSSPLNAARSAALSVNSAFKRLTGLGFPQRYPLVQFPNLPLIVALLAGALSSQLSGLEQSYARAIAYLGMAIWAYLELVSGSNLFRRLLGLTFAVIVLVRLAHAIDG
jgi:hypothetical protein